MINYGHSAETASAYIKKQKELELQPKVQIAELQKQTLILQDSKSLTKENAETAKLLVQCTKELVDATKSNSISAEKQFKSSERLTIIAIAMSVVSVLIQLFK